MPRNFPHVFVVGSQITPTILNEIESDITGAWTTVESAVPKAVATTKGDLLAATGSATVTRLGVGADGRVLTADATQSTGMKWALAATDAARSMFTAGQYYYPWSPDTANTSNTLTNGTLRLMPVLIPATTNIDKIGIEVTTGGDAASTFRPTVYSDNGSGYPGNLLLDGGGLASNTTGFKEATVATTLSGLVWIGGVVQGVTTTQPTVRIGAERPIVPLRVGTAIANTTGYGYQQTGVTGTPPSTFTATVNQSGLGPRIFIRVA